MDEVRQRIHFRFDEGGMSAQSTMRNPFGGALMSPRRWYHEAPFNLLSVVERKARLPLFACWFANSKAFVDGPEPEDSLRLKRFKGVNARGSHGRGGLQGRAMSQCAVCPASSLAPR